MGFIHKGGVWWFLLLAGVLLAAAAAAGAEQDDGAVATAVPEVEEADEARLRVDDPEENDSCDLKCQHHQVPARKKQCVDECHSREHHHPSRASCENKCSHWQDPTRKDQCVQQCMRRGLSLAVGGGNDVDEHRHAQEEEVAGRPCDRECQLSCQRKCQGWKYRTKHQQCVRQCVRGSNIVDDEHLRGWEAVAGAIIEAV
ncbi:hypothetical protein CFC21_056324 [Triticum aestivum]|uniref:Plant antimicrobial peptide domain-containing protein n=2 Tax=Triticum aestivum TaxID=4565 RepID=A0A3B6INE8_WHEAT|nr:antimicrobial peptides-like [Triticum aestivum]KAF7047388.1 hypothetical protein CFC21_056324 [Triticum aestivum]